MNERRSRPEAFRLDDPRIVVGAPQAAEPARGSVVVAPALDEGGPVPEAPAPPRRGLRLAPLFWGALGALVALGVGLAVDQLVRELFARAEWLGWLGTVLAALLAAAALGIALREIVGLLRLGRIQRLHEQAEVAMASGGVEAARRVARSLIALYAGRPETARGRRALALHLDEVVDAPDLLGLAERELLAPFDARARRMIMDSARRVSVVTAVSPRAALDMLFVLAECIRLVRRLATAYGGRPGALGLLRLAREVVAHLAVTGSIALTDGLVQQVVGHGVAARLSTRLGEGVVNGVLTARVGLAAIMVCRPLPFIRARPPRMSDVVAELTRSGETPESSR